MTTPRSPRLITLILMTGTTVLTLNMFLPSLPAIAAEFGVPYGTVTLAIGGYLAMTAVLALVIGPLSDRFGRRPTAIGALCLFIAASAGCVIAPNWPVFLTCRLLQGAIVSGFIIASAVVRDTREQAEAASILGYIAGAMAIAPLIGPMVGGLLLDLFGWRSNFVLYVGLGLLVLTLVLVDLTETKPARAKAKPPVGPLLSAPLFWAYVLTVALSTCAFYAFLAGAPLVVAETYGLSGTALGVGLGSTTLGFMLGSFLGARLGPRFGPNRVMIAGRIIPVLGLTAGFLALAALPMTPLTLFGAAVTIGIGNGFTTPAANAGAMSVFPELAGTASGAVSATTVGLGAMATTGVGWAITVNPTPGVLIVLLIGI